MNSKSLKAFLLMVLVLCMSFSFTSQADIAQQSTTQIARVTGLKVKNTTKTKQKLTWKKIKASSGYEVYARDASVTGSQYKKIKTLTKNSNTSYTATKRKAGHTYIYKVRAYKKDKKTKEITYGKDSMFVSATIPATATSATETKTTTTLASAPATTTTTATTTTSSTQADTTTVDNSIIKNPTEKQKYIKVFGSYDKMRYPGGYYTSSSKAKANMKEITVKTWDFVSGKSGKKTTRTWTISVHKNLASTVSQIFKEIYNGKEQFPIHELGGYAWRGGHSEHNTGTAIDINWTENYMVNVKTGAITCGKYWKPGEDPYSIAKDGEVAKIFNKYGFTQGDWGNSKDYMHFSYFGT